MNTKVEERGNEPAMPEALRSFEDRAGYTIHESRGGLTIREHFAGLAMQGLLACPSDHDYGSWEAALAGIANSAVAHADALIAALNGETK